MGHAHTVIKVNSGILGLGLRAGETPNGNYPNVMDLFYDQGLIGTKAFSLYLVSSLLHTPPISKTCG